MNRAFFPQQIAKGFTFERRVDGDFAEIQKGLSVFGVRNIRSLWGLLDLLAMRGATEQIDGESLAVTGKML